MRILLVALLVAVSASLTPAYAQTVVDGNTLLRDCHALQATLDRRPRTSGDPGFCLGYVVGFRDGHDFGSVGKDVPVYCAAAAVTAGQLVRVLIRWLEANPAQLHEPAGLLAALAYKDAFPCR